MTRKTAGKQESSRSSGTSIRYNTSKRDRDGRATGWQGRRLNLWRRLILQSTWISAVDRITAGITVAIEGLRMTSAHTSSVRVHTRPPP